MDIQNRCGSCFSILSEKNEACPICGWKEEKKRRNSLALPYGLILQGKYYIGRILGQGGFGITYLAFDIDNEMKIALKEYFPLDIAVRNEDFSVSVIRQENQELYEYGMERFLDEANALVRFKRNPGIVAVYALFSEHKTVYMAMQYLEGRTLMEEIQAKGGKLSIYDAISVLIPALDALRAVHEVGMLHRDISPDNIIVLPNRQIKLIDFGAARYAMKQHQMFSIIFKPGYTPEEQYRGKGEIGPWSDLYALSASFYHSITGKVPRDAMNRLDKDSLLPPSKIGILIPARMEETIMKSLAVISKDRFQSVDQFKMALINSIDFFDADPRETVKTPIWIWLLVAASFIDLFFIILLFIF